jgi:oligopeptidase B
VATSCSFLTNADGAIDFKIVTAPLASPERAGWRDLIPHRAGTYIIDIELYAGHLVRLERANALPAIVIRDLGDSREHAIAFDEAAYSLMPWAATNSRRRICAFRIRR